MTKAPPDGYTLLTYSDSLWTVPLLQEVPYDPVRDFSAITLAVTSAQPSKLVPGLPTVAASGVPGYESVVTYAMFAPAGTPAVLINRLHQEIARVLNQAEVKERFLNAGVETVGSSPEQLAATIKSDMARMGKVIKDAGIRAE